MAREKGLRRRRERERERRRRRREKERSRRSRSERERVTYFSSASAIFSKPSSPSFRHRG